MAGYNKKRKGLSLVEMLIAVILFGVMSMIGYKYYKNFFSTGDIVKKSQIGALTDQAAQISNAYDIYQMQFGTVPTSITDLNASNVGILAKIPEGMPSITGDTASPPVITWAIDTAMAISDTTTTNDIAFTYQVRGDADGKKVCQIFNNIMNTDINLTDDVNTTVATPNAGYTTISSSAFCYTASGTYEIVFVKTIY